MPNVATPGNAFLHIAAAHCLATECGYESINRNMIIGDIALAQLNIYKEDYAFAEKLRDLRHGIQNGKNPSHEDWKAALEKAARFI